jgi:type IV pilus assembly protein PilC
MRYKYKARTKNGKPRKGTIEASSEKSALYVLEKYGMYATSLKKVGKKHIFERNLKLKRMSPREIIAFTRQLAVMLKSGISPVEALKAQVAQVEGSGFREKILDITEAIEGGSSLSQALSLFPKLFDQFYIGVIRAGEASGKVANSLDYLATHIEREYNLHQKIKGAMIYPAFVLSVFIGVFFLATFFIIPKLSEVLTAFGGELPFMTKFIIYLSEFVRGGGWLFIAGIFLVLALLPQYFKKTKKAKTFFDGIILKLPILGEFQKKINLSRFAENFSVLLEAGLPITQALKIVKEILSNSVYRKIITEAQDSVAKGERISSVFGLYPDKIPAFVIQMIATGEESGKLDDALMEIVDFYQQEIERMVDGLPNVIEPLLIIVLGAGVAIMAVSIFIPLFKIGSGGMNF